jgi:RNA polymerase sigma-70 factor (ECF subfamily)
MEGSSVELLERARRGDEAALEALLDRHQAQIYRFGVRMCRDPEDAKDVLQETLLAMARGVREFRGASSVSTWLYSIARSFCIKKRRKSKFAPEVERSLENDLPSTGEALVDPSAPADELFAKKEVERALEHAIRDLDPKYREVLLLRDVEGLTAPEAAEVLGVSTEAVKSRLHRARLSVRARVAPLLGISAERRHPPSTCPDIANLFSRYLEGEIDAKVCDSMQRHVDGCERCRDVCGSLKTTLGLCRSAKASVTIPSSVQNSLREALREALEPPARDVTRDLPS